MAVITIDTEKDSAESIQHAIDFLLKIVDQNKPTQTYQQENQFNMFNNVLPSSGPQDSAPKVSPSTTDLLNMSDEELEKDEIKPSKGLTDFSQFMPF